MSQLLTAPIISPESYFSIADREAELLRKLNPSKLTTGIHDLCTSLERRFLGLIPKEEREIIGVLKTELENQKSNKFLHNIFMNMFDEKEYRFKQQYCWAVYKQVSPIIFNLNELQNIFTKTNTFWKNVLEISLSEGGPQYFFTLKRP